MPAFVPLTLRWITVVADSRLHHSVDDVAGYRCVTYAFPKRYVELPVPRWLVVVGRFICDLLRWLPLLVDAPGYHIALTVVI